MRYSGVFIAAIAAAFLPCISAFFPGLPLHSRAAARPARTVRSPWADRTTGATTVALPFGKTSVGLQMEIDNSLIIGGVAAVGGLLLGAGLVAFTENQGKRTVERGGLSDNMQNKFSAQFMEDDVLEEVKDVDDVRERMRQALRKNQSEEEAEAMTKAAVEKAKEAADDGW
ncbi:unnamed protein product [Choristocarpus tenellus]